jgi:uncharacterized OB-fold protein
MNCKVCGYPMSPDDAVCDECGTSVEIAEMLLESEELNEESEDNEDE